MNDVHLIEEKIFQYLTDAEKESLAEQIKQIRADYQTHFVRNFSAIGRKLSIATKAQLVSLDLGESSNLIVTNWTLTKLIRVLFIMLISENEEAKYEAFIHKLFEFADINELESLYASLNVLPNPTHWIARCEEGIRSNIGAVQSAVMLHNKFPLLYLSESSWNQMVLKSFFTDKDTRAIYGLMDRVNDRLSAAIVDYIYERDSAKRPINPMLWVLSTGALPPRAQSILLQRYSDCHDVHEKPLLLYALAAVEDQAGKDFYDQALEKVGKIPTLDEIVNR